MNRTKKLLAGLTISALLVGGGEIKPTAAGATLLIGNPLVQQDPTSVAISNLLRNVPKQKAMTLNEILARRPDLERSKAQDEIKSLLRKRVIGQTGDGSRYRPFRYYGRRSG